MPPTWDPLDDDPVTGDSVTVAFLELEGRTVELRKGFAGSSAPSNPQDGQVWLDTSASPHRAYIYGRIDGGVSAWQPLGPLSRLPGDLNFDPSAVDDRLAPFEAKALRLENRNALPAVSPTNRGLIVFRLADGECWVADEGVSGTWKGLLSIAQNQSYDTLEVSLADAHLDGTNPPTAASKGTVKGLLFDATNEKATLALVVPKNWQGVSDLRLRLFQVLDQAQLDGDDIEWTGEVRSLVPGQDKVSKTPTTLADSVLDIWADADGIDDGGGPHVSELVIDHDDATNPVAAGNLLLATVSRKTIGGAGKVGGIIVFRADMVFVQRPRHERA